MCGRYLLEDEVYADMLELILATANATGAQLPGPDSTLPPGSALAKGEVFPTNIAPVFSRDGAAGVKWGFPHWKNAGVVINARAETALEKNMFSKPLLKSRCVIPSSGFYEWDRSGGKKKKDKYLLRRPGESALYMAGMINTFHDADGSDYSAFVILTTAANGSVAPIHDRMPVILAPDERKQWIEDDSFMEYALNRAGPELVLYTLPPINSPPVPVSG